MNEPEWHQAETFRLALEEEIDRRPESAGVRRPRFQNDWFADVGIRAYRDGTIEMVCAKKTTGTHGKYLIKNGWKFGEPFKVVPEALEKAIPIYQGMLRATAQTLQGAGSITAGRVLVHPVAAAFFLLQNPDQSALPAKNDFNFPASNRWNVENYKGPWGATSGDLEVQSGMLLVQRFGSIVPMGNKLASVQIMTRYHNQTTLSIATSCPDTILSALSGRPFSDFMELPSSIPEDIRMAAGQVRIEKGIRMPAGVELHFRSERLIPYYPDPDSRIAKALLLAPVGGE